MLHDLWKTLVTAMSSWHQGKLFIEHAVAISHNSPSCINDGTPITFVHP